MPAASRNRRPSMNSHGSEHERVALTDHERRVLEDIETHLTAERAVATNGNKCRDGTGSPVTASVAMVGSAFACVGMLAANWGLLLVGLTAVVCVAVRCLSRLPGSDQTPN